MAITRAQIVRQLYKDGKRVGLKGGADASTASFGKSAGYSEGPPSDPGATGRPDPVGGFNLGGGQGPTFDGATASQVSGDRGRESKEEFQQSVGERQLLELIKKGVPESNLPGFLGAGLNLLSPFRNKALIANINRYARTTSGPLTLQGYKDYMEEMRNRFSGNEDDNDNQPIIPIIPIIPQDPLTMDQATEELIEEEEPFQLARAFRADGGIMGGLADGQMDEMGRQMYGLGKLVKKATRAVKKIAKSPIGKAALLGAVSFGIPGTSFGGLFGRASFGTPAKGLFGKFGIGPTLFANPTMAQIKTQGLEKGFFPQLLDKIPGGGVTAAITAGSLFSGLLTADQEKKAQLLADETGIDINDARNQILKAAAGQDDFRSRAFKAGGGIMRAGYQEGGDTEPVAKKTMPLLDMGGKEKDYRETGGFVDMGRMERADDVPARLSKNEFVFTADAVRNAGDGNIDKGAEVMYNMMKNLENGGDVSEESQGLEGARKMFQTSQRLEEVL